MGGSRADSGSQKKNGTGLGMEKAFPICRIDVLPREGVDRVVRPMMDIRVLFFWRADFFFSEKKVLGSEKKVCVTNPIITFQTRHGLVLGRFRTVYQPYFTRKSFRFSKFSRLRRATEAFSRLQLLGSFFRACGEPQKLIT